MTKVFGGIKEVGGGDFWASENWSGARVASALKIKSPNLKLLFLGQNWVKI